MNNQDQSASTLTDRPRGRPKKPRDQEAENNKLSR